MYPFIQARINVSNVRQEDLMCLVSNFIENVLHTIAHIPLQVHAHGGEWFCCIMQYHRNDRLNITLVNTSATGRPNNTAPSDGVDVILSVIPISYICVAASLILISMVLATSLLIVNIALRNRS